MENERNVADWKYTVVWVVCVIAGAIAGFGVGWGFWNIGFELIGSAVALVGAAAGGILMFFAFMTWSDNRQTSSKASSSAAG
jgi:hypothetical protein